ncbi:Stk1 family PASTA domain-containing Ser/Thr kinase [Corynebacterium halotolerans]|uniref:non-specific serine/threonine protein kinase n=1 Tax=Corynebacterium halotolerans YIM 70093 = DSM 44683 TaxID=1121362 RepID=M1NNI9_9CORY|nr:Stk1 family PASTA domain-containing Ser/Thr kinase [Corynebacterium halotolerans]AGF71037.1 serine/threonine-protein kinase [Corynebacterium halotolerans YIM 70093 = DSM 44683]
MTLIGNRYDLGEVIGTGGMSDVYAAHDTLLGRGVAVKMLRVELARDVSFRERFRREAQNSGRLNHPAIVAVYDTGETEIDGVGVPFIVMERVHGRTLRDIIREDGPLTPAAAADILIPACEALQASHDSGIIHRDVKPANIMITNTGAVKVMDFGIARALDDSTSAMTQTSAVIGTAHYLSPEQARGKSADARSDVYALGCVMYELVTGRPPFEGETPFAVAYQHVQEEAAPPSESLPDLAPTAAVNIDSVVLTAMAKHPADRYQTALDMRDDLELLARNAVTQAARSHVAVPDEDDAPTTVSPPVTPTRTAAAAVPPPVTAAATGAASSRGATRGHRGQSSGNRWLRWLAVLLALVVLGIGGAFAWDLWRDRSEQQIASQMVTVPDLAGVDRQTAVTQLEELELRVDVNEEPSPDVERNTVIRTNPTAGSQLQKGTSVTLTVSSGREVTDVPDVTGLTVQEAADVLAEAELQLEQQVQEESSDTVAEGQVVSQNPVGGSQISKGSTVTITVSTGPEQVRIPVLSGMQLSQAEATLNSLDFVPQVQMVDSLLPEGEVISVQGEGASSPRGSTVVLEVSNGQLFEMPDITRMDRQEALAALRSAGWEGPDGNLRAGEPVATGALIDQGLIAVSQPAEGETLRRDAVVTVRYWEFDLGALTGGQP